MRKDETDKEEDHEKVDVKVLGCISCNKRHVIYKSKKSEIIFTRTLRNVVTPVAVHVETKCKKCTQCHFGHFVIAP